MRPALVVLASALLAVGVAASPAEAAPVSAAGLFDVPAANLGDSFASGEGGTEAGPYLPGSDIPAVNQCHRSGTSAAELLARVRLVDLGVNAACSGATTANIVGLPRYNEPPQAQRLTPDLRRVYVMIGGNDIGFGTLLGCFILYPCDQVQPGLLQASLVAAERLGPALDAAYGAIRANAPRAQGVVLLYPPLLPPNGADLSRCPELNPAEVSAGNQIEATLNRVIAERARAHGFRVADPAPGFRGHDVCSSQPFFYRPTLPPSSGTYHPNLPGRIVMAASTLIASG